MNRILRAIADFFASPDPRLNLCVRGFGFLAQQPTMHRTQTLTFISIKGAHIVRIRGL